jgi:hypothetical protein
MCLSFAIPILFHSFALIITQIFPLFVSRRRHQKRGQFARSVRPSAKRRAHTAQVGRGAEGQGSAVLCVSRESSCRQRTAPMQVVFELRVFELQAILHQQLQVWHTVCAYVCACVGGGGGTLSGQCPLQRSASSTTLPQRHTHSPSSSETSVVLNVAVMVSASANPDAFSPAVTLWLARWATRPLSVSPLLRGSGPFCYFLENSMEEGGKTACDLCSKACSTAQPAACFRYAPSQQRLGCLF